MKTLNFKILNFKILFAVLFSGVLVHAAITKESLDKDKSPYSNTISYSVSSDVLEDDVDGNLFRHGVSYDFGYKFLNKMSTSIGLNANYQTVNQDIIEDARGEAIDLQISDVNLSFSFSEVELIKNKMDLLTFKFSLGNVFPTSEFSRDEGYMAVPHVSGSLKYSRGLFGLSTGFKQSYVANTYENDLAGIPNLLSSTTGRVGTSINFKYVSLSYKYYFGVKSYTDSSDIGFSGNKIKISTSYFEPVNLALATSNVNTLDDQFIDPWFYDPYQSLFLNLSIGVTF